MPPKKTSKCVNRISMEVTNMDMDTTQIRQGLAGVKDMDRLLGYLRNGRGVAGRPGHQTAEQVQDAFRRVGAAAMGLSADQAEAAIVWAKE
jgi:hypothetical protein